MFIWQVLRRHLDAKVLAALYEKGITERTMTMKWSEPYILQLSKLLSEEDAMPAFDDFDWHERDFHETGELAEIKWISHGEL